ncbi:MAG: LytR family transcriptional regulator [Actinobacteria bacterium]|nr:LytR family transcriptional regulator [Acidimicrobiia bacterium]NCU87087.1 LytR family transcriptional regulator [Actinomycetota bacterium]NDA96710.1 LytR family transcriptional regulator [Actinomycetota bacterium]NDF66600.1 LytR family transcriptional regulator [Actinomycetota bacterium]
MSQEQSRPRRALSDRRQSSGTTNVNSTLSIIIAVLAVLLGFFILRDIRNDQTGQTASVETETTVDPTQTTVSEVVVPTTLVLTSFKIQVTNASGISGSAGQLTTELQGRGYIVQPANNKSEITPKQTVTVVYYLLGSEQAAAAVANVLGGVGIAAMPAPIPTETGNLGEATVMILLGTDLAGKPLGSGAAVSVPVVPAVTTTTG